MERGAQALAKMLVIALFLGVFVTAVRSDYRRTFRAVIHGQPELSPIWLSNQSYYPDVRITPDAQP